MSATELKALADSLMKEGWFSDAADFFGHLKSHSELKEIKKIAIEAGNTFLLLKTSRLMEEGEVPASELEACASKAEATGKIRYAIKAQEKLANVDKVEALRALIATDGDIIAEAEQSVFIPETEEEFLDGEVEE